jgi:protease-4
MWREIQLTKKVKPVIASMSDYAASGGYYMAMGADSIVAQPTTITGSIGIFAILFNSEKLMNDKLGISFDGVGTNKYANFPSVTHGMTDFEKAKIQSGVNRGYESFTSKAAAGRRMKIEDLKAVASGRVWSGIEAKKNGLIDRFGGLNDAIKMAAKTAKIKGDDYETEYWPKPKNFIESIFEKASTEASLSILKAQYGALLPYIQQLNQLQKYEGMQMRMPFEMEIK